MGIIKGLIEDWKCKTPAEKVKTVLEFLAKTGSSLIAGSIACKAAEGRNKLDKVCISVAGIGLGAALGDIAAKPLTEAVDLVEEVRQERAKMSGKGESADA